jgi:hypothetical protein
VRGRNHHRLHHPLGYSPLDSPAHQAEDESPEGRERARDHVTATTTVPCTREPTPIRVAVAAQPRRQLRSPAQARALWDASVGFARLAPGESPLLSSA